MLGVVSGFALAVVPSCGAPPCGPQNCNGCCDSSNKCVPSSASNANTSCGTKGATCANCTSNNQVCNPVSFVCEAAMGTGGGSATGGGTGGGTTGGGTGGGTTGGGTGGGSATGGGTGGGTTGGGAGASCSVMSQNCTGPGESCLYIDQNGNGRCFTGACDVVAQNCTTGTDKCTYVQSAPGVAGRACVPAGTKMPGEACGPSSDDCVKGSVCVNGKCSKYCYTDSNCGSAQSVCASLVQVPGTTELPATCVTLMACDPLTQNCTGAGDGCFLTQTGPACIPVGTATAGQSCGATTNCAKGLTCVGMSAQTLACHAFCNLDGGMPTCATGQCGTLTSGGTALPWGACL